MLRGKLKEFSLMEVFDLISRAHRSGALRVVKEEESEGIIFFRQGEVFFAVTPENRVPLGLRLVDAELLNGKELDEALAEQKKTDPPLRLGQILIAKHYISAETLELFVQEQILDALFEMMSWASGEFEFAQDVSIDDEDIGIYMSAAEAIKEAKVRLGEWRKLQESLPSPLAYLEISPAPYRFKTDINLKPDEWKIIYHLRQPKTVAELKRKVHLTSPSLYRTLTKLLELHLLKVAEDFPVIRKRAEEIKLKEEAELKTVDLVIKPSSEKKESGEEKRAAKSFPQKYVIVPSASKRRKESEEEVPLEWRAYYEAIAERLARAQQGN